MWRNSSITRYDMISCQGKESRNIPTPPPLLLLAPNQFLLISYFIPADYH